MSLNSIRVVLYPYITKISERLKAHLSTRFVIKNWLNYKGLGLTRLILGNENEIL